MSAQLELAPPSGSGQIPPARNPSAPLPATAPPPFVPGVHPTMPPDEYRAIEALSSTGAKKLLRSAAHYMVERTAPAEPTPAMQFGTAVHCAILEPERLDAEVVAVPDDAPTKPTKAQREAKSPSAATVQSVQWWRDFAARASGRIVLSQDQFDTVRRIADAVHAHPGARRLLEGGRPELSLLWRDARYGVQCKARFDYHRADGGIVDLKTADDASPDGFARASASLEYALSAAFYWNAAEHVLDASPPFFAWVAVEKEEPFGVACYVCEPNALRVGMRKVEAALKRYSECVQSGRWPAYADTIEPLKFPGWYLREPA